MSGRGRDAGWRQIELEKSIQRAARLVEEEIARERSRPRKRCYPDLTAWRDRRRVYLEETGRAGDDDAAEKARGHQSSVLRNGWMVWKGGGAS